jgi:CHASE2 domain-containing sensor protein
MQLASAMVLSNQKGRTCGSALKRAWTQAAATDVLPGPSHAVCCAAGVIKHVQHLRVFITTTIISLWAYVWMLIVYLWWTPSEVRPHMLAFAASHVCNEVAQVCVTP